MGQNAPFNFTQGMQQPTGGLPGIGLPSAQPDLFNNRLPGLDPRVQAMVQQALRNPNAGDGFNKAQIQNPAQSLPRPMSGAPGSPATFAPQTATAQPEPPVGILDQDFFGLLPSPKDMIFGSAVGAGIGTAFYGMEQAKIPLKLAKLVNGIPGANWLNRGIQAGQDRLKGEWADEMFLRRGIKAANPQAASEAMAEATQTRNIRALLKETADRPKAGPRWQAIHDELGRKTTYKEVESFADEQIKQLRGKNGWWITRSREDKKLITVLGQIRDRAHSYNRGLSVLREQAALAHMLHKEGVGPLGRAVAQGFHYLDRIFGGKTILESMGLGHQGGKAGAGIAEGLGGRLLGSTMGGAMIAGMSFMKARKAKEGEKTQTFFHDFIGFGLANFVGWEVGRKLLNSVKFSEKIFRGAHKWRPLRLLGTVLNRVPLLKVIPTFTLGGIATELIAMFVFGWLFQKPGEWLAHKIFGKPSEESLDPDKVKRDAQLPRGDEFRNQDAFNRLASAGQTAPVSYKSPLLAPATQQAAVASSAVTATTQPPSGVTASPTPQQSAPTAEPPFSVSPAMIAESSAEKIAHQLEQGAFNVLPETPSGPNPFLPNLNAGGNGSKDSLGGSWDPSSDPYALDLNPFKKH